MMSSSEGSSPPQALVIAFMISVLLILPFLSASNSSNIAFISSCFFAESAGASSRPAP